MEVAACHKQKQLHFKKKQTLRRTEMENGSF